jgi:DNA-binding PadR family transcriptional regulator
VPSRSPAQAAAPLKTTDFHILFALLDGQLHGCAIAKSILERTDGGIRLEAGNLQRTLRKLVRQGLVEPSADRPDPEDDDSRRNYWKLTERGRTAVAAEALRLRNLVREAEAKRLIPLAPRKP